jgi:5-methylcytosine-specific restriction endonuclease McrA
LGVIGQTFTHRHKTYTHMTGREGEKGICWWCGKPHVRKTQCCSKECTNQYNNHFQWSYAAQRAIERANHKCQECGKVEGEIQSGWGCTRSDLEVHHIIPLEKHATRFVNVMNCPCNLIVLCIKCHGKTRRTIIPQLTLSL